MIASGGECQQVSLRDLLDDRLSQADEARTTEHLSKCPHCRERLSRMAADNEFWLETRQTLVGWSELSVSPDTVPVAAPASGLDGALAWVTSLLEPSVRSGDIGMLDGRPVRDLIGQGGMGVVLKVWDHELHRPLAVKLLSPMLASSGAARQRFFREAQAAAAVVHPNIIPIFSVVSTGKIPYLVMPLVAGGNLQQRIDREGPLPLSELLAIGLQIAEGLCAAHRQGLVHRDIKPANILLDEGGHRVMLSDFGLARALDDATLTASGMVAGTPHYMSPEQARGESVDHRSDVYSLGAVLYAMATGHPPARGQSPLAIIRQVTDESPKPVHVVNETMPSWFSRLVGRFLQKDVDRRIATAEQAAELLRRCLAHARSPAHCPLPRQIQHRFFSTRHVAVGLGTAVAITSIGIPAWNSLKMGSPGQPTSTNDYQSYSDRPPISQQIAPANLSSGLTDSGAANSTVPESGKSSYSNLTSVAAEQSFEAQLQRVANELELLKKELSMD